MVTTDGKVRKGNCGKGELEKLNFDEIMPQKQTNCTMLWSLIANI